LATHFTGAGSRWSAAQTTLVGGLAAAAALAIVPRHFLTDCGNYVAHALHHLQMAVF